MRLMIISFQISFLFMLFFAGALAAQPSFINKIPIPPLYDASKDTVKLVMSKQLHKFNPGNPTDTLNGNDHEGIEAWAYNVAGSNAMTYLGPTLKWKTGQMTHITVTNMLPQPTTTHWHGAEIRAELDGGPHQHIEVKQTWPVFFKNLDQPATLWYHPHFHDNTFPQVQLGLSGMIISEQDGDPIAAKLPRTYGIDDIPLVFGDQKISRKSGKFVIDTMKVGRPLNTINGVTNPYVELPAHFVRLRVLNGSTRKGIKIALAKDTSKNYTPLKFKLIATDGGYVTKVLDRTSLLTGPGERYEILLDLTAYKPGDVLYLRNLNKEMPGYIVGSPIPAEPGKGGDATKGNSFLQIRIVADPSGYQPVNAFTPFETEWDAVIRDTFNIDRRRTKELVGTNRGKDKGFTIDHTTYDLNTINDTICLGAKEVWTISNSSGIAHPFHIHKVFFRILDIDSMGVKINLESRGLNGPKDDVMVFPNWKLRFMAKFDDYPSPISPHLTYMYHCHILTHEDKTGGGMMHQFVVTDQQACVGTVSTNHAGHQAPMTLYPNPADGELFLMGHSSEPSSIKLVDIQGRVLKTQLLPEFHSRVRIDIQGLRTGMYFVIWDNATGRQTKKVLLQR